MTEKDRQYLYWAIELVESIQQDGSFNQKCYSTRVICKAFDTLIEKHKEMNPLDFIVANLLQNKSEYLLFTEMIYELHKITHLPYDFLEVSISRLKHKLSLRIEETSNGIKIHIPEDCGIGTALEIARAELETDPQAPTAPPPETASIPH